MSGESFQSDSLSRLSQGPLRTTSPPHMPPTLDHPHSRRRVRMGSDHRVSSCTKPVDILTRTYLNLKGNRTRMTSAHPVSPSPRVAGGIRTAGLGDRVGTSRWKSRRPRVGSEHQGGAGLCIGPCAMNHCQDPFPSSEATSSRKPLASRALPPGAPLFFYQMLDTSSASPEC